jgi:CPA1 family monovalent cation:H+ antiporter
LIYLIEGMVFLMTGLQARSLIARFGSDSIVEVVISAAIVSAVVIVARFVWMYPATYLPRWLFPPIERKDPAPPGNGPSL